MSASRGEFEKRLDQLRAQAAGDGIVRGRGVDVSGGPIPPHGYRRDAQKVVRGAGENATGRPGYYGMPVVKPPVWTWEIPVYFFIGGLAGMSAVIAAMAWFFHQPGLARAAIWTTAIGGGVISPALLIMDLGRPILFINMLRVFKYQSPMSLGSWILTILGGVAFGSAFAVELHHWEILPGGLQGLLWYGAALLLAGAAVLGALLATYTGVLIGATAIPAWFTHRSLLPAHFGTAAMGSAASWFLMLGYQLPALRMIFLAVAVVETFFWLHMLFVKHGAADRALHRGYSGITLQIAGIFAGPIALGLLVYGLAVPAAIVFLAAAFFNRMGWIWAGRVSGHDPEAVFASQS